MKYALYYRDDQAQAYTLGEEVSNAEMAQLAVDSTTAWGVIAVPRTIDSLPVYLSSDQPICGGSYQNDEGLQTCVSIKGHLKTEPHILR